MTEIAQNSQEVAEKILSPMRSAFNRHGIDEDFLVGKLQEELGAHETKTIKVKGHVSEEDLTEKVRIIADTGGHHESTKGNIYIDGETVLQWDEKNWPIRQKARIDVHKMRGDYPAEKHEHSGYIDVIPKISPEDRKLLTEFSYKVVDAIVKQHCNDITAGD